MTQTIDLQDIIVKGIQGLPKKYLSEVADFVVFMRRKASDGKETYNFDDINYELSLLDAHEIKHLEEEFKDFDLQFPKEWSATQPILWRWFLNLGKRRLPPHVKQIFELTDVGLCEIIVPSVVFFEICYLSEKDRIDVSSQDIIAHLAKYPTYFQQDLTFEIISEAFKISDIPELHDRLIGGTAKYLDIELITNDPIIMESSFVKTFW